MSDVLIIGYGNTLRGDDAAGVRAAESIRERAAGVEVLVVHELQPELAETIACRQLVIFVDASEKTTSLSRQPLSPSADAPAIRSHHFSPGQLLALSRTLYGSSPSAAWLFEIPACSFNFGDGLSEKTAAATEECVLSLESMLH